MTTATRPVRVALLGYGVSGGTFHAPLIAASPGLELAVIVTPIAEQAARAAARYPSAAILGSPDELWRRAGDVDLVVVATANASHVPLALAAIENGLAVVVEKPLAVTAREAEELLRTAQTRGVPLTTFLNRRWDGDFLTLRDLIAAGRLGTVRQFESRFTWWQPVTSGWRSTTTVAEGGGALYDLGPHVIDQAVQLFGPVVEAHAELDRLQPDAPAEDHALVRLVHAGGVRSRLWMSGATPLAGARFWVLGSRAGYVQHGLDPQESQLGAGMDAADPRCGVSPESRWGVLGTDADTAPVPTRRGEYGAFYAQLVRALTGDAPLPVDPADAIATLALIERLHEESSGEAR